jgi:TolB-like protein/tetratricopeptide (TPR) repeat protein
VDRDRSQPAKLLRLRPAKLEDPRSSPDSSLPLQSLPEPSFSEKAMREELARILTSRTFRAAQGQRKFLAYTVEKVIAKDANLIKEYVIGTEAFGRDPSFDPRLDSIVRTEARKLRARLAKYYETEGREQRLRVGFRKGSYVPFFHEVVEVAPDLGSEPAAHVSQAIEPALPQTHGDSLANGSPNPLVTLPDAPVETASWGSRVLAKFQPPFRTVFVAGAIAALALSVVAAFFFYRSRSPESVLAANNVSIAVLPLVNLGDHQDEFLSDGLTEEIIDSLRRVPGLQVVARTSVFRFKGKSPDIKQIGQALHAGTVLVGSVLVSQNRLRVTVQLNSAANEYHLWSGSYDRDPDNSRTIPQEIAGAITNVLGVALAPHGGDAIRIAVSPNPGAHEAYLKGLYFWNRLTPEGLSTATEYFKQAIAEDPSFARAYSALADCYVMGPQVATIPPLEIVPEIKATASKALELQPSLGEPHFDLAFAAELEFDWQTAEKEFKKGLELSPENAVGHLWYAKFLALVNRRDEVLVQRQIAARLDPVSPYAVQAVGGYFSVTGHYPEAIEQFRGALALEPNFGLALQGLGVAYALDGKCKDAVEQLQLANKWMTGPRRIALLGWVYGRCGQAELAQHILRDFLEQAHRGRFPALAIAQVYIGLGDKDHAFEWLDKAIDQRDLDVTLLWDSPYEVLRSDARFNLLLRRMKLA